MINKVSELTWFTKGLRRLKWFFFGDFKPCPNWPDLRRDCDYPQQITQTHLQCVRIDLIYEGIATLPSSSSLSSSTMPGSELTWFTKGLRPHSSILPNRFASSVRIDLIYEGIATYSCQRFIVFFFAGCPNWPDLRRDCDIFCPFISIDSLPSMSELTWFTKGLRPYASDNTFMGFRHNRPNWPDLRRDCDFKFLFFSVMFF